MKPLYLCLTTVARQEDAERLAGLSVQSRLAACAQIDAPITSVYRWQDAIARETEYRISLVATESKLESLEQLISDNHPYDTPKWVCLPIEKVSEKYLKWAKETSI